MKTKIVMLTLALLAIMGVSNKALALSKNDGPDIRKVSTAEEFIANIGSDRTIEIVSKEPLILTDAIDKMFEEGKIAYVDLNKRHLPEGIGCYDNYDGKSLAIIGVHNLAIYADEECGAELLSRPRYADVLKFVDCRVISLENITLGHTDEGYCEDGVLGLIECTDVAVNNCDLFGCGTEGIVATYCNAISVEGTTIHDCSYHIMHLKECNQVYFNDCRFKDNREYEQINVYDCSNVQFNHCEIYDNQGTLFDVDSPVTMTDCTIKHSGNLGSLANIKMHNVKINEAEE